MKKNKILAICILCLTCLGIGCTDWLDYTPKDKKNFDNQFDSKEGFFSAVNGVYSMLHRSSLYGYNLSHGALDVMGQCYYIPNSNERLIELRNYRWTEENAQRTFASIWEEAYKVILNANLILKALEDYNHVLTPSESQLIEGEMLALRAFIHFDLLRLFGPVYSLDPSGLGIPYQASADVEKLDRLPANELITDKILPDLSLAQELLLEVDPIIKEGPLNTTLENTSNYLRYRQLRLNYYAITLIKARVYLWASDTDKALIEAKKIIEDSSVSSWFPFVNPNKLLANNTNPDRIFSTECLFGFYSPSMKDVFDFYFSGTLDASSILQPRAGYLDILFSSTSDYRRQSQWVGSTSSSGSEYDFVKYKSFKANKDAPEFWATFYGLVRLSEAYYIAAEANLNNNNIANACFFLNTILSARGCTPLDKNLVTENEVLKQIKLEYLREMRGEGQIFFLHKRFYQNLGQYSGGEPALDGSASRLNDQPGNRYVIPVPEEGID